MTETAFHQTGANRLREFQRECGSDFAALSADDRVRLRAIERLIETEEVVRAQIDRVGSAAKQLGIAMESWRKALDAAGDQETAGMVA